MKRHDETRATTSLSTAPRRGGSLEETTDRPSVCIVIPAYNEAETIGGVVRSLAECYPDFEIIVVDDGSTDATVEHAARERCRVLRHGKNRGYGAAIRTGAMTTKADVVLCFDADGQHDPDDLARLLEAMEDADMVVGARTSESHQSLVRRPGKWVLSRFADFLLGERLPDLNSGLRAFRREVLLKYMHLMPSGFSFSTTSTFAFYKGRRVVRWVPITTRKRIGKSSVRQLRDGFGTLLLMVRLVTLFEPLKIFLPASIALLLGGVASGVYDVLFYQSGLADTTVLLLITALLVFFFGLICDQISAVRREIHP